MELFQTTPSMITLSHTEMTDDVIILTTNILRNIAEMLRKYCIIDIVNDYITISRSPTTVGGTPICSAL